jgi:hypothetical protein
MKLVFSLFIVAIAIAVTPPSAAQQEDSICVKYTKALFDGSDTPENEIILITALVNMAFFGNEVVPGILSDQGGLSHYFNGSGRTTNRENAAVKVNFLDGAPQLSWTFTPEAVATAAVNRRNSRNSTNTSFLLDHLSQFFGALLGCSTAGGFPLYTGLTDMYELHKFMFLTDAQVTFFIAQFDLAASLLGVSTADVNTIAGLLDSVFNRRCTPNLEEEATAASGTTTTAGTFDHGGLPDFLVGSNPSICHAMDCIVVDASRCPLDDEVDSSSERPCLLLASIFITATAGLLLA